MRGVSKFYIAISSENLKDTVNSYQYLSFERFESLYSCPPHFPGVLSSLWIALCLLGTNLCNQILEGLIIALRMVLMDKSHHLAAISVHTKLSYVYLIFFSLLLPDYLMQLSV